MHKVSQSTVVSVFVFKSVIFFPPLTFSHKKFTSYLLYYIPVHKNPNFYVLIAFKSRRHVDVELGKRETGPSTGGCIFIEVQEAGQWIRSKSESLHLCTWEWYISHTESCFLEMMDWKHCGFHTPDYGFSLKLCFVMCFWRSPDNFLQCFRTIRILRYLSSKIAVVATHSSSTQFHIWQTNSAAEFFSVAQAFVFRKITFMWNEAR